VARVEDRRGVYSALMGKTDGNIPGLRGKVILKWKFQKWNGGMDCINLACYTAG
jgi:hypothetical protein